MGGVGEPETRIRATTQIGLAMGGVMLLGVLGLGAYIVYLNVRYPGLTDPPARPVDYWPEIGAEVSVIGIGLGLLIGLPVFLVSLATLRRSQMR